jgi:poly-gamma-glutamate synthesis protein (capsule biosynthesis protein)
MAASYSDDAQPLKLSLCGDVMLGRGIDQILPHPCPPPLYEPHMRSALGYVQLAERASGPIPRPAAPAYVWGDALEALARARPDLRIMNLETSVTCSERAWPKGVNYRMSPENLDALEASGVDCCVLANNHVMDWGPDGLMDTLASLQARGVRTAGAGRDLEAAAAPAVLDLGVRGRVLVFGLCLADSGVPAEWRAGPARPGVNLVDLTSRTVEALARRIAEARRPRDVVVASIHWGPNWGYGTPDAQRRFAHALVDRAGVALVHGHSSHHPKGAEVYTGRLILYGCGDALNDYEGIGGYEAFRSELVLLYFASLAVSGELRELEMTPFRIRRFRLERASAADVDWLVRRLDEEYARFGGRLALAEGDIRLLQSTGSPA